jgi:N-acetyl-anhydromuramyl-L-alanine amidase AmpD
MPSPFDNDGAFLPALERWGYDVADGHAAVRAFQRRRRPHKLDGDARWGDFGDAVRFVVGQGQRED